MIISFDAVREALQNCLEGKINLCVECNPLHGPRVAELIQQYLAGQTIPKQIFVEEQLFTPADLTEIAAYAFAIGPDKNLLRADPGMVARAHAAGLAVHAWTFRAENQFLPPDCRIGESPADRGDVILHDAYLWHSAARATDDVATRRHVRGGYFTGDHDTDGRDETFVKNAAR